MLGAKIGSSVLLDTVDITEPYLVSIGDGAVIAEGALVQSHEVKNGILNFYPIRIGQNSSVGPYAVIQIESIMGDGAEVLALQMSRGKTNYKSAEAYDARKDKMVRKKAGRTHKNNDAVLQFFGIYMFAALLTQLKAMFPSSANWRIS